MTATINLRRFFMDRYQDEGEWMHPCSPVESGLMTCFAAALYLAPVVAFLYFLLF
jgi:hypothetical protein